MLTRRIQSLALLFFTSATTLWSQDPRPTQARPDSATTKPEWISRRDLRPVAIGSAAVVLLSLADETIAHQAQRPRLQHSAGLNHVADIIQVAGDPGALLVSASLYGIGRVSGHPLLADASWHAVKSIALSAVITQSLKLSVGRGRPNLSDGKDAFAFHTFHGGQTDYNSFPSGHTTAAFAAASAFSSELSRSHPKAARVLRPALFGVATLVGGARMYNNRHWLSDVAAGALIGGFTAHRVVEHAHNGTP